MTDLLLTNVRIEPYEAPIDLAIHDGSIVDIGTGLAYKAKTSLAGGGKLLIPGFVESHIHLDIALMNDQQLPGRTEPYLSHYSLNESLLRRRKQFTSADIEERAVRSMQLASRHGVTAMRAQCHIDREVGLKHLKALVKAREKCKDIVDLQLVAFPQQGLTNHPDNIALFKESFGSGIDVMGAAPNLDRAVDGTTDFRGHIDMALTLAMDADIDLDVHGDLGLSSSIELDELESVYLAKKVIEHNYHGRVAVGHLCALDSAEPEVVEEAIHLIAKAKMHVVSQPDLYRLGRSDTKHIRRGLTRVKELISYGVNVSYASNNVRDALRPMGNFDLLEEGLLLVYGAHMDTIKQLNTIVKMSTINAARMLGLKQYGLKVDCKADMVLLDCQTPSQAIIGQVEKLCVIKNGCIVAKNTMDSTSSANI